MSKIILTVGVSGSGKSTWAHEQWKENPLNTIIVSRDNIRYMFGYTEETIKDYYSRPDLNKLEKQVTLYEDSIIHEGLNLNKTVIVDATHLKREYLVRYKIWNVPVEVIWFDTPIDVCIERDKNRNRTVGEDIIKKQYKQFLSLKSSLKDKEIDFSTVSFNNDLKKPPVWVFDIDGTLAHKCDRDIYDLTKVKDDFIDNNVASLFEQLYLSGEKIIICSGREETSRVETLNWIKDKLAFDFSDKDLLMRSKGDFRPDWIVKEELWREIAKNHYICGLIDDRNQVVRRARAIGLKVFQVEYGNF